MNTTNYKKHSHRNPIQKLLIENFYKSFFNLLSSTNPTKILDAGCGEGETLKRIQKKGYKSHLSGFDINKNSVKFAQKEAPHADISVQNIYDLPYKDNSFDTVLSMEVLEHLEDPKKAIQELKRVSSKHLILTVPHEPWFQLSNFLRGRHITRLGNHPEHINHWTAGSFEKFIKSHKLQVLSRKLPFAWIQILAEK